MKFKSLTVSPETAAIKVAPDGEFTFGSFIQPTKKIITHFDNAPYKATYINPNMMPLRSGCNGQQAVFCAEPRLEFCWEIIAGLSAAP